MNTIRYAPRQFVHGDGNWLIDADGQRALDFYSDTGTASLGFHTDVQRQALQRVIDEYLPFQAPNLFYCKERDVAAQRYVEATGMERVFFANTGAEAVETAIKAARKTQYHRGNDRFDVYGWKDSFHGRTLATLALADGPRYHREGFGPLPSGFHTFTDIEDIRPDAGAVCLAPVYGNYDLIVYEVEWLAALSKYCQKHGILLIFDEVMTGAGRTAAYTYGQRIGIQPDIIAMAKGMACGTVGAACAARGDAAEALTPGSHFSTHGGNPLTCMFINAMLDWLQTPGRYQELEDKGAYIRARLADMIWPANVRGVGMLNGFDIVGVDKLVFAQECLKRDLLVGLFRPGPGPVKITPPLTITREEIDWGMKVMDQAYKKVLK
jgi:acetylornithine/succinyldiaminopimelate/putrescine aminotransferase